MKQVLSFDDVLITPKFSNINSRADVDVIIDFLGVRTFPIISSNMDTVTGVNMGKAMNKNFAMSCLHRFMSIEENIKQFNESQTSWVSVGIGKTELERFEALFNAGAVHFVLDVAHGASTVVVNQVLEIFKLVSRENIYLTVGNFAREWDIKTFNHLLDKPVDAYKVGIGGGSACTTRVKTGCGLPTFQSILDCSQAGFPIIADGGIKNSGDFSKALAAGADVVMLGGMLAGTDESPGKVIEQDNKFYKKYRGSASLESYQVQGKVADHRTPEGDSFLVPCKGSVDLVIQELVAGLRSAMSYVGASNLEEFRAYSEFVQVSHNGFIESQAHGKK